MSPWGLKPTRDRDVIAARGNSPMKNTFTAGLVALAIGTAANASANEPKLLVPNGMKEAVHDLAPQFEHATGHKRSIRYGPSAFLQRDMEAGESFDVTVV